MSKISNIPKLGTNDEILYSINIYEENGILKVELDEDGNIKTNIHGLISKIIDFSKNGKIIEIDHDLYSRLNNGINTLTGKIKLEVLNIIKNFFYFKK